MAREERFLEVLAALGGSAGNGKLQAELGWQDGTYARVRAALLEEGRIVKGRGRGGSVTLAEPAQAETLAPVAQLKPAAQPASRTSNGNGGSSFEQIFKNIDDVLWKEAGCTTELDYTEQTSWMLFLKYLDDLEFTRATEADLHGRSYTRIIDEPHNWASWAAPKKADGSFDRDRALTGSDLIDYVNRDLFPYLQGFKARAAGAGHYRVQDRRDFLGNPQQVPERLFAEGRAGADRRAAFPLPGGEARAFAFVRSQDQEHGQCGPQRGRVLHPAPAHPRHDRRGETADRRAHL